MSTTHNRIKVADLEKNEQNKILTTNSSGELEFSNLDEIKIDSYNGLDYTQEGKSLDARQGKVLKDLVDNKIDKNFGLSQPNKLLGTDTNGNLKFYSTTTYPAPFLGEISPNFLPNSTGNLTITGAFFTPSMTVSIVGQTVNYITFVSDNLIKVNITTGSAEGNFAITLNNGLSATFQNALSIVLGTTFSPITSEWSSSGSIQVSNDQLISTIYRSTGSANWSKQFDYTKKWSLRFRFRESPLGTFNYNPQYTFLELLKVSDNSVAYHGRFQVFLNNYPNTNWYDSANALDWVTPLNTGGWETTKAAFLSAVFELRFDPVTKILYCYVNNGLYGRFTNLVTENLKLKLYTHSNDFIDIKYIELAS